VSSKNVHTEHCCKDHGCKYNDNDCPIVNGVQKQSYPCEECEPKTFPKEKEIIIPVPETLQYSAPPTALDLLASGWMDFYRKVWYSRDNNDTSLVTERQYLVDLGNEMDLTEEKTIAAAAYFAAIDSLEAKEIVIKGKLREKGKQRS